MRIAVLAHSHHRIAEPYAGGLEMHTAMVADALVERGHDVTLMAKEGSRTRARLVPIVGANFKYHAMFDVAGIDRSQDILDLAAIAAISEITSGPYDVVLNNSLGPFPYRLLHDVAMLTILHTPATLERVLEVVLTPGWSPGPLHSFAAVSDHTARDWRRVLPTVSRIHNGIDLARWASRGRSRARSDIAVWAARIAPEKGLDIAIEAATRAGLGLLISGPIVDRKYFDRQVQPRLSRQIRYLGHLDHRRLATTLRHAGVFLSSPRWEEPFGLSMVEAMAAGTPVAALPAGAAAEIVGTRGGVLSVDQSAAGLAAAALLARRLDRDEVARSATRFAKDQMVDEYERVLYLLHAQRTAGRQGAGDHPTRLESTTVVDRRVDTHADELH